MFYCSYAVISALARTTEEVEFLMNLEDYMDDEVKLLDFSLTVKAAPHECVTRTSQP